RSRGRDPIADNRARRHRQRADIVERVSNSFTTAVRDYIDQHARRNVRRWREIARVLGFDYPIDGGEPTLVRGGLAARWAVRAVGDIDAHDIRAVIDEARRTGVPGTVARVAGPNDSRARVMARALSGMFTWLARSHRITSRPPIYIPSPPDD